MKYHLLNVEDNQMKQQELIEFFYENWLKPEVILKKYKQISEEDMKYHEESDLIKGFLYHKGIFAESNYIKAKEYYLKFLENNPNNIYCLNVLGVIYYANCDYEITEKYYLKVLEIDPYFKYSLSNLGNLYKKQNKYIKAEKYLLKALDIDPKFEYTISNLKDIYQNNSELIINNLLNLQKLQKENEELQKENNEYALHETYKPDSILFQKIKKHFENLHFSKEDYEN